MNLDLRSVAISSILSLFVFAIALFYLWRRERTHSMRDWAVGMAIAASGNVLVASRDFVPDLFSAAVGNTTIVIGFTFLFRGMCRLIDAPWHRGYWLISIGMFISYLYFILVSRNVAAWSVTAGYARFALCACVIELIRRHGRRHEMPSAQLLVFSVALQGLFMAWMGCSVLMNADNFNWYRSSIPAWAYLVTTISSLGMFLGMLSMHTDSLLTRLKLNANTDVLTGLPNRRHFVEVAELELNAARFDKVPLWALMIDIDHFKRVNDTYGHAEGDRVLKEVGAALLRTLRQQDVVARYGGEEFCVILPHSTLERANAVAQRLLRAVSDLPRRENGVQEPVTISIGAATLGDAQGNLDELLKRADQALYRAKQSGRNAVVGFSVSAPAGVAA